MKPHNLKREVQWIWRWGEPWRWAWRVSWKDTPSGLLLDYSRYFGPLEMRVWLPSRPVHFDRIVVPRFTSDTRTVSELRTYIVDPPSLKQAPIKDSK